MKENIVKNGARVISFAPDDESTNILGTVTSNYGKRENGFIVSVPGFVR